MERPNQSAESRASSKPNFLNMAEFNSSVQFVLENEDGFVDHKTDPGGATNFGISLAFVQKWVSPRILVQVGLDPMNLDVDTIKNLSLDQAKDLYKYCFWLKSRFEEINNQQICDYVFDSCVQHGIDDGVRLLQRALNAHYLNRYLAEDGLLGTKTLTALNHDYVPNSIICLLVSERRAYMESLVLMYPKQKIFLNGWVNRAFRI